MVNKVVIFNEIAPQLREVVEFFERISVQVLYSADGRDSHELIKTNKPAVAVLSVAMPGLSGIEVSRRVKIDEDQKDTKVVLISDFSNESIKNRAMEAGCDLYLTIDQIPRNLYSYAEGVFKVAPRFDLRVKMSREISLLCKGKVVNAQSINLSCSGVLALSSESFDVGEMLKVVIKGNDDEDIGIDGVVARLVEIPGEAERKVGLGIKFTANDERVFSKLNNFISFLKGEIPKGLKGKKIELKPLTDLLLSDDAFFAELLGDIMRKSDGNIEIPLEGEAKGEGSTGEKFSLYFPKLQGWEIGAFAGGSEETEVYLNVIRKMAMLYVKFENCNRVVNDLPFCDGDDERTLFNILQTLLDQGLTSEKEIDQILNSEISMRTVGLSSQIAKTRNRYIDSKVKLLRGLTERYKLIIDKKPQFGETIRNFDEMLEEIKKEAMEQKERKKDIGKEVEEKKEVTKEVCLQKHGVQTKYYIIGGASLVVVVIIAVSILYNILFAGRVSVSTYSEPGILKSGKHVEDVLILICDDKWNPSRDKEITTETLNRIYDKVKKDKIFKIKLNDSSGKALGQVLSTPDGKPFMMVF